MVTHEQTKKIADALEAAFETNFANPITDIGNEYSAWLSSLDKRRKAALCKIANLQGRLFVDHPLLYHGADNFRYFVYCNADIEIEFSVGRHGVPTHLRLDSTGVRDLSFATLTNSVSGISSDTPFDYVSRCAAASGAQTIIDFRKYVEADWELLVRAITDVVNNVMGAVDDWVAKEAKEEARSDAELLAAFDMGDAVKSRERTRLVVRRETVAAGGEEVAK